MIRKAVMKIPELGLIVSIRLKDMPESVLFENWLLSKEIDGWTGFLNFLKEVLVHYRPERITITETGLQPGDADPLKYSTLHCPETEVRIKFLGKGNRLLERAVLGPGSVN